MRRLTRDGTVEPVSRDQIFRREREQKKIILFLFQLTTSRIGNLTRSIHNLDICVTIYAFNTSYVFPAGRSY